MTTVSAQTLQELISGLEALPLTMGGGDAEREALVTRLRQAVDGCQELRLPDLWLAMRLLGPADGAVVCDVFARIAGSEAAAVGLSSYPVSGDNNPADNLLRKLTALELPMAEAHRRAALVRSLQEYLDNRSRQLAAREMVDAARFLGEEGYALVESLLRSLFVGPLELACSTLWTEVTAHFGVQVSLEEYLQGARLTLPKRSGAKSARVKNLLPHITAAADAAYCLSRRMDVNDIDDVTDRVASKLELFGETELAAELENALGIWSEFVDAYRREVGDAGSHIPGSEEGGVSASQQAAHGG